MKLKEPGSAITHFFGIIVSIFSAYPLIHRASTHSNCSYTITIFIFWLSMLLLYSASTLYHSIDSSDFINQTLKKVDHCMVFILIAGSYTPLCVLVIGGVVGKRLLIAVWITAIAGCIFKFLFINSPKWITSVLYIAMGWICLSCFKKMIHSMSPQAFHLLLAGGLIYTAGGIIYTLKIPILDKHKNFGVHEIFHLFILAGSICHILFMYLYVCV